jgi:hypothetical protein
LNIPENWLRWRKTLSESDYFGQGLHNVPSAEGFSPHGPDLSGRRFPETGKSIALVKLPTVFKFRQQQWSVMLQDRSR